MNSALINGINIYSPSSRNQLIELALERKSILIAVNAEKIINSNEETRNIINRNMGYPDGIGAVWALNKKGLSDVVKIPGCELWLDIISQHSKNKSFYLVGGSEEVIQNTIANLKVEFPMIQIANYRNGYLHSETEKQELISDIFNKKPDIVFVAMGSPKQELLMEEMHRSHPALYQGLGGSFDVYTDNVKRAPKWWIESNLEWVYRLLKQPARFKRQIHLVKFFFLLKLGKL